MDTLKKIDELRISRGWSMNRLAEEAALTQSTVAHMFARGTMPTLQTLVSICEAFGITLAQFFADGENEEFLTADETELVKNYRKLSGRKKDAILTVVKAM